MCHLLTGIVFPWKAHSLGVLTIKMFKRFSNGQINENLLEEKLLNQSTNRLEKYTFLHLHAWYASKNSSKYSWMLIAHLEFHSENSKLVILPMRCAIVYFVKNFPYHARENVYSHTLRIQHNFNHISGSSFISAQSAY